MLNAEDQCVLLTFVKKAFKLAWKLQGHEEERSDTRDA